MSTSTPAYERERLRKLQSYQILDTAPEADFNDLVRVAASVCNAPTALISLVDAERQWFKARIGLSATETPRDQSFCAYAIKETHTLVIPDAGKDDRFRQNPLVVGEPRIRYYAGAPLRTSDGHGLGALCVIDTKPRPATDPMHIQVLEALSRQAVLLLELRHTARQLAETLGRAHEAERHRAETLAFLSHDLRAPMSSVLALAKTFRNDPTHFPAEKVIDEVEKYAHKNLDAAEKFLQLARAEGSDAIDFYDLDLSSTVHNAVEAMYETARDKGTKISVHGDVDEGIWMHGNAELIERALINLLSNAIKYGPEDGAVSVKLERLDGNDVVSVQDEGPGIPEHERDDLFKPYYRSRRQRQGHDAGVGLGLAFVKAVARRHAGRIEVECPAQGGTVFQLRFPRA